MSDYQVGLNSFQGRSDDFAHSREGHLDHLAWSRGRPSLRFFGFDEPVNCDGLLGEEIRITVHDENVCTSCGGEVESGRSLCWGCAGSPPMRPCIWHPGTECSWGDCPYPDYKRDACAHNFVVYLVVKDEVKVGITRGGRRQARWAEQGASHAIIIGEAHNRKVAGIIEDCLSEEYSAKSDSSWYVPCDEPVPALVDTAREAGQYFPERLATCYSLAELTPEEIRRRVVTVPARIDDVAHEVVANHSHLSVGDRQRGRVLGVRGSVIATDAFTFNTKQHGGRWITLETMSELAVPGGYADS